MEGNEEKAKRSGTHNSESEKQQESSTTFQRQRKLKIATWKQTEGSMLSLEMSIFTVLIPS